MEDTDDVIPLSEMPGAEFELARLGALLDDPVATHEKPRIPEKTGSDEKSFYIRQARRLPVLTQPQEVEYLKQYRQAKRQAEKRVIQNLLIEHNLGLVIKAALRYTGRGLCLDDLIQEGIEGLRRAIKGYRVRRKCHLSTYATFKIHAAIQRALQNLGETIRLPVRTQALIRKVQKERQILRIRLGRTPSLQELAGELNLKLKQVEEALAAESVKVSCSLDQPVLEEEPGRRTRAEYIPATIPTVLERLEALEVATAHLRLLERAIDKMPPEEAVQAAETMERIRDFICETETIFGR